MNSTEPLPPRLLAAIRGEYRAELDVRGHHAGRPLPAITLGVRAKLVDARGEGMQTLWSCDEVFNSGNPAVANSRAASASRKADSHFPLPRTAATCC